MEYAPPSNKSREASSGGGQGSRGGRGVVEQDGRRGGRGRDRGRGRGTGDIPTLSANMSSDRVEMDSGRRNDGLDRVLLRGDRADMEDDTDGPRNHPVLTAYQRDSVGAQLFRRTDMSSELRNVESERAIRGDLAGTGDGYWHPGPTELV